MAIAKPETVAKELFSELETLFKADTTPDNFTLTRLERQAASLQHANAADASMIRAGIAALRWDTANVEYWLNNSLVLDGTNENMENAALTWRQVLRMDRAAELLLKCYENAPRNSEVLNNVLESLNWLGKFDQASVILAQAKKDGVQLDSSNLDPDTFLQDMQELGIDQKRVEFEISSALNVLLNNRRRIQAFRIQTYVDHDGSSSIVIGLQFLGSLDDELRFESELAAVLSAEPGWNPCALTTELQYLESHVVEPA